MPHKLLLADDSVTIQRVIELTFADEDVQVSVVGDGRQAIERVRAERPDIVLADIGMPERDGYEVAAFIKGDPQLAQIPVVLLMGAFEPLDEDRARSVGCDGVLVKPFEPQMVIARVKELLAGHRPSAWSAGTHHTPVVPQATTPQPAGRQAPEPDLAPTAVATTKSVGDSLEDYFDRLDAAFANVASAPVHNPPRLEQEDLSITLADLPPAPAARPAPSAAAPAPDPVAGWDPDVAGDFGPARQPHLANAFAALLAAEEGHPLPDAMAVIAPMAPAVISDDTIEEIARRVIARMADDSMRRAVVDTAERLVREEIDRIKRAGGAGSPTGSGS
jgi:CheY-like chemotaxis protein